MNDNQRTDAIARVPACTERLRARYHAIIFTGLSERVITEQRPNPTSPYTMDTCDVLVVVARYRVQDRPRGRHYDAAYRLWDYELARVPNTHWDRRD